MYPADNTQQSARFLLNPFQSYTFGLGDVRDNGVYYPQPEGDFIYVEQADYPVTLTLVDSQTNIKQAITLFPGLSIAATFKGFTLQHPTLSNGLLFGLRLLVGKGPAVKTNESAYPVASTYMPFISDINTALSQQFRFPVPPGSRMLTGLHINCLATTVTSAILSQVDEAGLGFSGMNWTQGGVVYGTSSIPRHQLVTSIRGLRGVCESNVPIALTSRPSAISVQIDGTGLNNSLAIQALFA